MPVKLAIKKILLTIILTIILSVIILFGAYKYIIYISKQTGANYYKKFEIVKFEIKRGESFLEICEKLQQNKVIASKLFFFVYARYKGFSKKIKAGEYAIPNNWSNYRILMQLIKGGNVYYKITIPEGFTLNEIAELIEKQTIDTIKVSSADFKKIASELFVEFANKWNVPINNCEGFLLPETYSYTKDDNVNVLIKMIFERFDLKTNRFRNMILPNNINFYDLIKLASIVQREAMVITEMPIIAGVYINRLRKNMLLQADPTIIYGLGYKKNRLLYKDLKIDTPYNTYLYPGLPPTPICNPGFDAIYHTVYFTEHNYLFFVADLNGTHLFSATNREHDRKRQLVKNRLRALRFQNSNTIIDDEE